MTFGTHRILIGDVLDGLRTLADGSARCCVTSPPYWGLRDYGTGTWEGGDDGCDHRKVSDPDAGVRGSGLQGGKGSNGHQQEGFKSKCGKCGARRVDRQLGLEPTPDEYVARMVGVFREVRRVLRDDGTLWLNLGDTYAANRSYQVTDNKHKPVGNEGSMSVPDGLKPKDLVGIPWLLAFALRADGWYLRSDIIWSKPNPMPESVTDRPTKAHEYIFLLSKSQRYYFDAQAVREASVGRWNSMETFGTARPKAAAANTDLQRTQFAHTTHHEDRVRTGRHVRSVWTIPTQPYADAHFAAFPEALPERCIRAGSAVGDTVLDPFAGSGTTLLVACRLGRNAVGCELNPAYAAMAERRIGAGLRPATFRDESVEDGTVLFT